MTDGLAIYDTMQFIKPTVSTLCIGQAASMGSFLLAAGKKVKNDTSECKNNGSSTICRVSGQATDMRSTQKRYFLLRKD